MRGPQINILVIAILISLISIFSIYSSASGQQGLGLYQRQMLWVACGLFLFFFFAHLNYLKLWDAAYLLYAATLLLLLLVLILGAVRSGAQRWLKIAWFNLQPAEVAKLSMIILLARYYSRKTIDDFSPSVGRFGIRRALFQPLALVVVPMFLIMEQPDLGSALLLLFIFLAMLYLAGVRFGYILILLFVTLLIGPAFWHYLRDYQRERIMVFLNPNIDPLGAGYTVIQSKIAIGSGMLLGKGWLSGTQSQLRFLPEAHTDFIFASFAEEWGLLGCVLLLCLYYLLLRQGIKIALRTNEQFGRLLGLGICFLLAMQIFINIAMNFGIAPVVGLPLPLLSYGGSAVLVTYAALGILVSIERRRAAF